MTTILGPLLIAFFIGYQIDEAKPKQYEMLDDQGQTMRVQFSKKSKYSCPLTCSIDHYHYTETLSNHDSNNRWSVVVDENNEGQKKYNVNGITIASYKIIDVKKIPKGIPGINSHDFGND